MTDLTIKEKARARALQVESWTPISELKQEFIQVARSFVNTDDLLLLDKWCIWRDSDDDRWGRIVEVDVFEGASVKRLKELLVQFETLWREDLGVDALVFGETFSLEPKPERKGTQWEWRTLADAYEEKPPREYIVEGLLPCPSLVIIFGNPGDLKTMLAQDLALCVAAGKPWLAGLPDQGDVKPFGCEQTPVLWVDCDNGLDRIERRFAALGAGLGISVDAPLGYVSFPVPPFVASNKRSLDRIVDAAVTTGARLIVIDYLGAISGGADENSSQMIQVMNGLRHIAETTGAVVVVIHHKTKADKTRAGHSLRGHSSIEGAVDLALLLEREEGSDSITLKSTKSRDAFIEPFEALWTYETDGRDLVAGRFYGLGPVADAADSDRRMAREAIVEALEERPGQSQAALVKAVREATDMGKGIVIFALKQLVKSGQINQAQGERKHWFSYSLAEV